MVIKKVYIPTIFLLLFFNTRELSAADGCKAESLGIVQPLLAECSGDGYDALQHDEKKGEAPDKEGKQLTLAQRAERTREAYIQQTQAYTALYQERLESLVGRFDAVVPPSWMQGPAINDPKSYRVVIQPPKEKKWIPKVYIDTDGVTNHMLSIPYPDPVLPGNMQDLGPQTLQEVDGVMRYALADATSFTSEQRRRKKERLYTIKNYALFATWLATTPYWINSDYQNGVSGEEIFGHVVANTAAHFVATLPINYAINLAFAPGRRAEQKAMDARAAACAGQEDPVDSLVINLARRYIAQNIINEVKTLQSRSGIGKWLCCCPVFGAVYRCLRAPLRDASEPDRIATLLQGSYTKLENRLQQQGVADARQEAATRVCTAYDQILDDLYGLRHENLDQMMIQSRAAITLTPRTRRTLNGRMDAMRATLSEAMPTDIRQRVRGIEVKVEEQA